MLHINYGAEIRFYKPISTSVVVNKILTFAAGDDWQFLIIFWSVTYFFIQQNTGTFSQHLTTDVSFPNKKPQKLNVQFRDFTTGENPVDQFHTQSTRYKTDTINSCTEHGNRRLDYNTFLMKHSRGGVVHWKRPLTSKTT